MQQKKWTETNKRKRRNGIIEIAGLEDELEGPRSDLFSPNSIRDFANQNKDGFIQKRRIHQEKANKYVNDRIREFASE